jgi:hypothetical protein
LCFRALWLRLRGVRIVSSSVAIEHSNSEQPAVGDTEAEVLLRSNC